MNKNTPKRNSDLIKAGKDDEVSLFSIPFGNDGKIARKSKKTSDDAKKVIKSNREYLDNQIR